MFILICKERIFCYRYPYTKSWYAHCLFSTLCKWKNKDITIMHTFFQGVVVVAFWSICTLLNTIEFIIAASLNKTRHKSRSRWCTWMAIWTARVFLTWWHFKRLQGKKRMYWPLARWIHCPVGWIIRNENYNCVGFALILKSFCMSEKVSKQFKSNDCFS